MDPTYLASFGETEDRHWWFRARREIVIEQMRRFQARDAMDLLDVGCGTGGMLSAFSAAFPQANCRGIEPDAGARQYCADRGLEVTAGNAVPLAVASESQDAITILDALEHLDDDGAALAETTRALRPGGFVLITVPAYQWLWGPHDELNDHKRRYRQQQVESLAIAAGLEVKMASYFNSLLFPAAVIQRFAERTLNKRDATEKVPVAPLNTLLYRIFSLERPILRRASIPWGLSILVVASKPDNDAETTEQLG